MKQTNFENVTSSTANVIASLAAAVESMSALETDKLIAERSPYSDEINRYLLSYQELYAYCKIRLQEAFVTRRALIREIDPNLWVSVKGKTNLQLMLAGKPPYAYDAPNGAIELHHVGQRSDAPFAELTAQEHMLQGNNKILHQGKAESWRTDPRAEAKFSKERTAYWKKRAKGEIALFTQSPVAPIEEFESIPRQDSSPLLKKAIETLFAESSITDLRYLSDLAQGYVLAKEMGVNSISDFASQNKTEESEDIVKCSFCGASEYSLSGRYMNGSENVQRYKCHKCGRNFTALTRSIVSGCTFSFLDWLRFVNCMYNGISEQTTAELCHIDKRSVHDLRLKVFYALTLLDKQTKLRGKVVIDETYFPVSFKGNQTARKGFVMPRKAHKRGSENHTRGVSKNHVCVVCAMDEYGNCVARVAGLGLPTARRIQWALQDVIDRENLTCIYSDKESALASFAEKNGYPIKQAILLRKNAKKSKSAFYSKEAVEVRAQLQRMNAFHSRLDRFLGGYLGVSSHLLSGYLCLFTWKDRNRAESPSEAYRKLMSVLLQPNLYKTVEEIKRMPCFQEITNEWNGGIPKGFRDFNRAAEIYRKHAEGEKTRDIASSLGVSVYTIRETIYKFNRLGYGYRTKRDILAEETALRKKQIIYPYKTIERNQIIYKDKMNWDGTSADFYAMAMKKYQISVQTIKNIVALEERIIALREDFFIYETFRYETLQELYQSIYSQYQKLAQTHSKTESVRILAEKYRFKNGNVQRIIGIMSADTENVFWGKKRKLSIGETLNRDKALFVDFLKWNGPKINFCKWAREKYGLSVFYVYHILSLNFIADSKRYENTYRKPTRRKE